MSRNREAFRRMPIVAWYRGYCLQAWWSTNILGSVMVFYCARDPGGKEAERGADPYLPSLPAGIHWLKKCVDDEIRRG